jgi:hypothetical protein
VKVSPWFHRHFTVILWHITDISPRKNTDQGDFLLKRAVRAVYRISAVVKVETDIIISMAASSLGWAVILVILFDKTFRTSLIVFIGNNLMCFTSTDNLQHRSWFDDTENITRLDQRENITITDKSTYFMRLPATN